MKNKVTVTEQTLRDLLDNVGLLFAGMGHNTVERQVLKLRAELDGKPEPGSATIYQFPTLLR